MEPTEHARALTDHLMATRQQLLGFIRGKLADPSLAEDILHESLLKGLRAADDLRDDERLGSWFYTIVRNAIQDTYRRRGRSDARQAEYVREREIDLTEEDDATICACFRDLIPALKPEYAELIETLDLGGGDVTAVAARLGITSNNLKVRRHRARQQLRQRLEETCRTCARHGCLDCTCSAA
jgi:RNA polymerase sigma-70 factor (ECF subfamily)